MTGIFTSARAALLAAMLATASVLGGCASDGVELNGKIFEAVGLAGNNGVFGKREEPRVQARAPLVLPPDATRLPDPTAPPQPVLAAGQEWPRDSQQQKVAEAEAKKRAQEQHCRDGNWKEKAHRDEIKASQGPSGTCGGSLLSVIGGTLFGNSE